LLRPTGSTGIGRLGFDNLLADSHESPFLFSNLLADVAGQRLHKEAVTVVAIPLVHVTGEEFYSALGIGIGAVNSEDVIAVVL
jgi:hypothetical protein